MYKFELEERAAENLAAPNYHRLYHGVPVMSYWDSEFAGLVKEVFKPGGRLLDLGCGPGSLWPYWKELPSPGTVVGVDLSEGMIFEARKAFPDGSFLVGRAHEIPADAGSFDVVVASAVLHHIPDSHLDGALAEIQRVLEEHGTLIGREPVGKGHFGSKAGWTSGALMDFRHLVTRLTHAREEPEPALGEHHHSYDPEWLLGEVGRRFTVTKGETRFPVSNYFARVRSSWAVPLAKLLDAKAAHRTGSMLQYVARKNYVTSEDLAVTIDKALGEQGFDSDDREFLAYLRSAGVTLERMLGDVSGRDRDVGP